MIISNLVFTFCITHSGTREWQNDPVIHIKIYKTNRYSLFYL